jgi:hypothetical protein
MDTFNLVGTDDDIGEGAAFFDLEDSVRVTTFGLASARNTAIEHDHSTIKRTTSRNGLCCREDGCSRGGWE